MNKSLSQIVAGLFEKSKAGEDPSSKIRRLHDELKKVMEGGDTVFGKFRELMASFEIIIPDEKQRYTVAIKALSTTSKLSRQEIITALNKQLEELTILKKGLLPAHPEWRNELAILQAKSQELKGEISKLREHIGRLESEEQGVLSSMAMREKEMALVEKSVEKVFTDIGEEITAVKKGIEAYTAEATASLVIPPVDIGKSYDRSEGQDGSGRKSDASPPQGKGNTEWQKKCPMCGGQMNFLMHEKKWQCYTCAYEEEHKDAIQEKREEPVSSKPQDTELQKKCPMCGGQLNFLMHDKKWQCYTCAYEEVKK